MKSKSCEKSRGAGVPSTTALTAETTNLAPAEPLAQAAESDTALCRHIDAAGRRCNMLVMSAASDLCAYHAQRRLQTQRGSETAAAELLACGTDFHDAESVNRFLGTLVRQLTLKRIPRRDAVTLAYICQLLLNSLGAGYREEALRLEEQRVLALEAQRRPSQIIWDIPGPPYEPPDPLKPLSRKKRAPTQAVAHKVSVSISIYSLPAKPDGSRGSCAIFGVAAPHRGTPFSAVLQFGGELARADASFQLTEDHTQ
jgi:hypothetical protein